MSTELIATNVLIIMLFVCLSDGSVDQPKIIEPEEIYNEVINQTAVYHNDSIINGSINLSNISIINSSIEIADSIIKGSLDISNTKTRGSIKLENITIEGKLNFNNARIGRNVYLENSILNSADFSFATFLSQVRFINCSFHKPSIFKGVTFRNSSSFQSCNLSEADFEGSTFEGECNFAESNFTNSAFFTNSEFKAYADLSSIRFAKDSFFGNASFKSDADFRRTQFAGSTSFKETRFSKLCLFEDTKFFSIISFLGAKFDSDVDFTGAEFGNESRVDMCRARLNGKFYVRWQNISSNLAFDDETYLYLIENYKRFGWFEDADECYLQYRTERRTQAGTQMGPLNRFIDMVLKYSYGYGVKPEYPIFWSAVIIGFFWVFWWTMEMGVMAALRFSTVIFFSGTKLSLETPEVPKAPRSLRRHKSTVEFAIILEKVLGGLFSLFFLLAIVKTIVR